jgi:hypothetical protein
MISNLISTKAKRNQKFWITSVCEQCLLLQCTNQVLLAPDKNSEAEIEIATPFRSSHRKMSERKPGTDFLAGTHPKLERAGTAKTDGRKAVRRTNRSSQPVLISVKQISTYTSDSIRNVSFAALLFLHPYFFYLSFTYCTDLLYNSLSFGVFFFFILL